MKGLLSSMFGLGWTKALWSWYYAVWAEWVAGRRGDNPLVQVIGVIITLLALVVTIVASIVTVIVDAVAAFFGLFNDADDDDARAALAAASCPEVNAMTNTTLARMTESLLDGPTGDDDEDALRKIVECLECERLRTWYWPTYGERIRSDTHGSEYDQLLASLIRCELTTFSAWDDDASRAYINRAACAELRAITLQGIQQLLRNLFEGRTGDADEQAINKLIQCMDPARVRELVRQPGYSVDEFDDEVDGSEWRVLREYFRSIGIPA